MKQLLTKICGLTQLENAQAVARLQPDFVGFIFVASSPRCVAAQTPILLANTDSSTCPSSGPRRIGVFRDQPLAELLAIAERWQLDGAQLHGSESIEYCQQLRQAWPGAVLLRAGTHAELAVLNAGLDSRRSATLQMPPIDYFLVDSQGGGTGQTFNWQELCAVDWACPVFLAGGLGPSCIEQALSFAVEHEFVAGFDFNSKLEHALPGLKDVDLVKQVLTRVRQQR
jgi:phosphoribosylanthranilate isomerase